MKLLIATPLYPPDSGGPATYSRELEQGLPARGIEVILVKFTDVRRLPKIIRHIVYGVRVYRAARGCDLVYALDAMSVGVPARIAAAFARKPFVVKIVGDYAWEQGRQRFGITTTLDEFVEKRGTPFPLSALQSIQTRVAKSARCVIVPSSYLKGIVEAWGLGPEHIEVINNAIRSEEPTALVTAIAALPRPLVVSVGRLVPWKGFGELVDALAILRDRGVHASLAVIGDGPDREWLERHARARLGDGAVCAGALSHRDTFEAIRSADVFVLDSLYEGLSHTLIEALLAGTAIVASDIGGNREVIRHEDNGLLVPPGKTRPLAEALERLLTDPSLRTRLSARARESAEKFSIDRMLAATASALRTLVV